MPPTKPDVWLPDDEVVEPPALMVLPPAAAPPLPDFPPLLTLPPATVLEEEFPLQATQNPMPLRTRKIAVCLVIASPWCIFAQKPFASGVV
jgi:hypothetical protein